MSNSIGTLFRLTCFGESHGPAIGGVIDGCPAGLKIDISEIQRQLDRRRPGQSKIVTQRKESDKIEILSGVFEGKSTGAPIGFIIRNEDSKSGDYDHLINAYRPGHADLTYDQKYGFRDHRGGGRSSARATAAWVAGGAIAGQLIAGSGIKVNAYTSQVGEVQLLKNYKDLDLDSADTNDVRCPDELIATTMIKRIEQVRKEGDTIGGVITGVIRNVPAGLGEPLFNKLSAALGHAMLSINAVKGFEIGSGFGGVTMKGSEHNDHLTPNPSPQGEGRLSVGFKTNNAGGVLGGISNGDDILFRVAFKPVATIMQKQMSVNQEGKAVEVSGKGRHDPCVLPRAVPIVEALAALVIADHLLMARSSRV